MNAVFALFAKLGLQPDAATVAIIAAVVAVYFSTLGKDYLLHAMVSSVTAEALTPHLAPLAVRILSVDWSEGATRGAVFGVLFVLGQFALMRSPFAYPLSTPRGYVRILWLVVVTGFIATCLFRLNILPATTPLVAKIFTGEWSFALWLATAWALLVFFRREE